MKVLDTDVKELQHKTAAERSAHMNPRKAQTGATVEQKQILSCCSKAGGEDCNGGVSMCGRSRTL
jgi:hypothetical protein